MTTTSPTIGSLASSITSSFTNLTRLITAGSYLAGLGFSIGAIMKFKQHKDNPTQIPIGTPIALDAVAAALLFLPTTSSVESLTAFESAASSGDLSASSVKAAAEKAGISASGAEAAAEKAGITSSDVADAETAVKAKAAG
jgi:intracellular multiplication protein IcmD